MVQVCWHSEIEPSVPVPVVLSTNLSYMNLIASNKAHYKYISGGGHMESTIIRNIRVFIASPFFSEEQVDRVQRLEQSLMRNPYVSEIFSARFHQFKHLEFGSKEWRRKVFRNDLRHLRRSDVLVGIRDYESKYVDSGTAFEIGYAYAMRKPILLINEKNSIMNLMMANSLHAYFTKVEDLATYDFHRMPKVPYEGTVI